MKNDLTVKVALGDAVDMFSESQVEGMPYYDYYSKIAEKMWTEQVDTLMEDNRFFRLGGEPEDKVTLSTSFGVLRCNKLA